MTRPEAITEPSNVVNLRQLRDLNTDDLLEALALGPAAQRWPALRRLFDAPTTLLARLLAEFDASVGRGEGTRAARALLSSWGIRVEATGQRPVSAGPRLFVSNHPGLGDVLALLAVLDAPDLRLVARDRPFLRALPHLADRLFLVPERGSVAVLRRVRTHLLSGGAVLTFPAGRIEPDPAWTVPDQLWSAWSSSTEAWAKTIPGLVVQPLLVAGVRHPGFVDPWFAKWRRASKRDWTAAVGQLFLQVLWARPRRQRIEVAVGEGLTSTATLTAALSELALRVHRAEPSRR